MTTARREGGAKAALGQDMPVVSASTDPMDATQKQEPLIRVDHLKEYFPISTSWFRSLPLKAVDDVSFSIDKGTTLGLVGESGCGKTTVGRTILHLYEPTGGDVYFKGKKIRSKADISAFRREAAMVFRIPIPL